MLARCAGLGNRAEPAGGGYRASDLEPTYQREFLAPGRVGGM